MITLSLIIAIVALILSVLAFQRTGGVKDLRKNTAFLLAKLEQTVSNGEKTVGEKKVKTKK